MRRALTSTPMHKHPRRFDHGRNVLVLENDVDVERERDCTMGVKARCGPRLKQQDVAPLHQRHLCHHIDNPTVTGNHAQTPTVSDEDMVNSCEDNEAGSLLRTSPRRIRFRALDMEGNSSAHKRVNAAATDMPWTSVEGFPSVARCARFCAIRLLSRQSLCGRLSGKTNCFTMRYPCLVPG